MKSFTIYKTELQKLVFDFNFAQGKFIIKNLNNKCTTKFSP